MTKRYRIQKAQELYDKGYSQKQIAAKIGVNERTFRRWKENGLVVEPVFKQGGPIHQRPGMGTEKPPPYLWSEITASELVKIGVIPKVIPTVLASLGVAERQNNIRAHQYLKNCLEVSQSWPAMPEAWRAVIAGFPIVSSDIGAPSMNDLAKLLREIHPYLNRDLRREYHRRVKPILVGILAEVQAFILDSANTVDATSQKRGLPLIIIPGSSTKRKLWGLKRSPKSMGTDEAQEQLSKGKWEHMIPAGLENYPIENTFEGTLYDIISRLPDPDRQKGKLLGKRPLTDILFIWCFTARSDFRPPPSKIRRRKPEDIGVPVTTFFHWKTEARKQAGVQKQPWLVGDDLDTPE